MQPASRPVHVGENRPLSHTVENVSAREAQGGEECRQGCGGRVVQCGRDRGEFWKSGYLLSYDTWVGIGRKRRGDEYSREGYGKDKGADTWCVLGTINSSNQNVGARKEWVTDPAGEVSKGRIVEDYKLTFPGEQWGAIPRFQAREWKDLIYVLESSLWPDILCMFKGTGWRGATRRHGYLKDLPSFTLKPTAEARESLLGPASSKLSFPQGGRSVWWTCNCLEKSALSDSIARKGRRSKLMLCRQAHWVWGGGVGGMAQENQEILLGVQREKSFG